MSGKKEEKEREEGRERRSTNRLKVL